MNIWKPIALCAVGAFAVSVGTQVAFAEGACHNQGNMQAAMDHLREARAALDTLPDYAPLATSFDTESIQDAVIGHTYVLAERWAEALPFLQRAVANCDVFFAPLAHTRAALELGSALEATGDERAACEAYSRVLARWGSAKPRSVTADKARARVKALACGR